jgi:uncharacterized protein YtpQ (UPF0354 family)
MSPEMFTTLVVARLRSRGFGIEHQGRLEVKLRSKGKSTVRSLEVYYRRYFTEPSTLNPLIEEVIGDIPVGDASLARAESFEKAAPGLMPLLVSTAELERRISAGIQMVVLPLVRGLGVALVLDVADSITFVDIERLEGWQVDLEFAFKSAIANLERRSRDLAFSRNGEDAETLLVDRSPDGYAATRALLPSRVEEWPKLVPGELVLGVPNRRIIIGFSSRHPNLEALAEQVREDARADECGLSKELLVHRAGKLEIYGVERG